MRMHVQQQFEDFSSFEGAFRHYENVENVKFHKFHKRDPRTMAAPQSRLSNKKLDKIEIILDYGRKEI